MRNQRISLHTDIRADRRFEALIKKEMQEHQHLISSHNKEMQSLRDFLSLTKERLESLSSKNEEEIKDFKTFMICTIGMLKEKISANEFDASQQKKTLEDLNETLMNFQQIYATNNILDKIKNSFDNHLRDLTMNHLKEYQEMENRFMTICNHIKDEVKKIHTNLNEKINEIDTKSSENFRLSHLEKEGVLKEIRVYDKTIFIIEKKIENIYTLIERINKRGESCHKPA